MPQHAVIPHVMYRYRPDRSYDWNYEHAPPAAAIPELLVRHHAVGSRPWDFCGLPVDSPLGIPAGPLLNGRWVLWYARLGYDVLTYKTVRSRARPCYPEPNLQPVREEDVLSSTGEVAAQERMTGSWAISFGMPSQDPEVWRRDVEWTRSILPPGKVLSVSVVGTMQPGWALDDLAADYARCAAWAVEAGAHCIDANLSCPNVSSADGQVYQHPEHAARVARAVRAAVGETPVLLKIGQITKPDDAADLVRAVAPWAEALVMVNCLSRRVRMTSGQTLFDGELRGIGGAGIRAAAVEQVRLFAETINNLGVPLQVVGVGGASTVAHVQDYLNAGASAVHLATAAMLEPTVGLCIRHELDRLK